MEQVVFQVGAKAARLIGRENIADVDGALIELIKNSYDADATCVYVDFYMPFPDIPESGALSRFSEHLSDEELNFVQNCYDDAHGTWVKKKNLSREFQERLQKILFSKNRIIIADNGTGMTLDTVKSSWMYIGTSSKEKEIRSDKGRVKTGAKGIGRFALDKLSAVSLMYTKSSKDSTISWRMNWEQFDKARLINDVKADIGFYPQEYRQLAEQYLGENNPVFNGHDWSTGTIIILSPTREAWSERLFRKVNTNLRSINPIGSADKFEVTVTNHFYPKFNLKTEKVSIDPEDYDYRILAEYDGKETLCINLLRNEVDLKKRQVTIEKYGDVRKKSLNEFWARDKFQKDGYRKSDYDKELHLKKQVKDLLPDDPLEKIQQVGPFTAEFYFLRNANNEYALMKKVAVQKRKRLLAQFSGIKLYRDDFKVRPYGDEGAMYDWIGMAERVQKSPAPVSHKTGAWRVQPYQMIGLVRIGRESNPNLDDMANREGIALTDTYYIFVSLLQSCLKEFEFDRQYVYREYAKWVRSIESEMADYARRIQEEAIRRAQNAVKQPPTSEDESPSSDNQESSPESPKEGQGSSDSGESFSQDEMFSTVYRMMQESEKELRTKQMLQLLSSSGILINTFFHEFNAINTQFHVEGSQIRSRVNYILKGKEYQGLPAYNPYNRIDSLEKNDMLTAAFLDVIMDGLREENTRIKVSSLRTMITDILSKWARLLEDRHIFLNFPQSEDHINDNVSVALIDMYIIVNNFILNAVWFLEQEHNDRREISFSISNDGNHLHLFMENNGPVLAPKFRDNPDKIFEMGETAKEKGGRQIGTGLGLWIVKEAVERYDGTVSVLERDAGFGLEIIWKVPERRL